MRIYVLFLISVEVYVSLSSFNLVYEWNRLTEYTFLCFYHQVIADDVKKSELPFCLHFDETSTTQAKKQMDLTFCYWSPTHNKVWINFYTSLFFGHAEAEKVANLIVQTMTTFQ